jgi:hypothetical protein
MQQYAEIYLLQNHLPGSNVAKFGHVGGRLLPRYYDLYHRLKLQFYALLMMGAMNTRDM